MSVRTEWRCRGGDWDEGCTVYDGPCAPHCGLVLVVDAEPCPICMDPKNRENADPGTVWEPPHVVQCPACSRLGAVPVGGEVRSNGVDRWLHIWLKEEH